MADSKDAVEEDDSVLCMYISDLLNKDVNPNQLYFRKSPFTTPIESKPSLNLSELVKYDKENNIHYLSIGVAPERLAFPTDRYRWPDNYVIFFWIKWAKESSITVFDSSKYSPIWCTGYDQKLGCGSPDLFLDDYKMIFDEWQCVIVYGGNNKSKFYVGDLLNEPKYIGEVDCDIAGRQTYRIGNKYQGPGDVGCILTFDKHKSMEDMIDLYYSSIWLMGSNWKKEELQQIQKILLLYTEVDEVVNLILELIIGNLIQKI